MNVSCPDIYHAIEAIARLGAQPSEEVVHVFVGDRLVFASYEGGRQQILRLGEEEREVLTPDLLSAR